MNSDKSFLQVVLSIKLLAKCIAAFLIFALVLGLVGFRFENRRAERDWKKCKVDLEAKGEYLDLKYFTPSPVPDEKNFALTPLMKPLVDFIKDPKTDKWAVRDPNPPVSKISNIVPGSKIDYPSGKEGAWQTGNAQPLEAWQNYYRKSLPGMNLSKSPAEDILTVFSSDDAMFAELRGDTQTHLLCRYPWDPESGKPQAHVKVLHHMIRVLSLRASAELVLNRPDDALADLHLGFQLAGTIRYESDRSNDMLRMVALAVLIQPVWEGIASHRWSAEQLAILEKDLQGWDFLANFNRSARAGRAYANWFCEMTRDSPFSLVVAMQDSGMRSDLPYSLWKFLGPLSRASMYRNQILINTLVQEKFLTIMDEKRQIVNVARAKDLRAAVDNLPGTPYTFTAKFLMPLFSTDTMQPAMAQTSVNEAAIACEIERYRLAHGQLPATLNALQMPGLPHDVINGQPLHYRVTADDNYVLYSVGWNETDDGGKLVRNQDDASEIDYEQGDWIWSLKPL